MITIPPVLRRRKVQVSLGILIGIVLWFTVLRGDSSTEQKHVTTLPEVQVLSIAPGLQRSFSTTGEVEAEKSANFLADYASTIEEINVRIGDRVTQGQLLMTLRADEVVQDLTTANAVYVTTAQGLAQTRIQANQTVAEAQIALKTSQINLEKLQKENLAKRKQAEETLKSAKLNLDLSAASAQATLDTSIRKTDPEVRDALTYADELLEFSPVQEGLSYTKETHLGVRDPAQKLKTEDALIDAYNHLSAYRSTYADSIDLLRETEQAMRMLSTVLFNSVTSPEYTQDTLNDNIDTVNDYITSIRNVISDLETTKRSLDNTKKTTGNTSQVIIDAEAAYATTMAQLEASEKKAELDVERAKSALDSAIASGRAQEISAISNVTSARGSLDMAQISNDKLIIVAPFDGVVTDIPVRVGREVQPGELVLSMEDASELKIVTFVSALEVKSLSEGDRVTIDTGEEASILSVSPSADLQSKKYKVEVRVQSGALQAGELVSLTYYTETIDAKDPRMFLPVTAIHVSAAETFVWIVQEDQKDAKAEESKESVYTANKRPVVLGELSGKYVEIASGLQEGDRVVLEGGRALTREGQQVTPRF